MKGPIDLTPFWCLMGYDQRGARIYAYGAGGAFDPQCQYPSTIGALTHRPFEARKFASKVEAEAAIPNLAPWVEAYVRDWQRRERDSKEKGPKFTVTLPLRPHFENDLVHVFPDGSGLARDYRGTNMAWIAQEEEAMSTLRAFIQKHLARLEGVSWSCSNWKSKGGPLIELGSKSYAAIRGRYVEVAEIAALWPVEWRRRKPDYPDDKFIQYDWVAQLDGVTLVIDKAENERIAPRDFSPLDGTKVKLGKAVAA